MKALEKILKGIEHYLADKKGISKGSVYPFEHFKGFSRGVRTNGSMILTYNEQGRTYEVAIHETPQKYWEVKGIRERTEHQSIEVRL